MKVTLAVVFAVFGGAITFLLLYIYVQHLRRRRGRRASLEGQANASNGRPPSHLTVLERAALSQIATDPESIRQLRQRRWTARHGNNGLTVDELDLVAPVRPYEKAGGAAKDSTRVDSSSDDEGGCERACEGKSKEVNDVESGIGSWAGASDDTCAVCLDDMAEGDKTRKLRCSHEFHADCIQAWVTKANRCPVCSVEPLEAAAIAKRRNARSSTRRGIDAAISQQRRRRTRGANGVYELDTENANGVAEQGDDAIVPPDGVGDEETTDEITALPPPISPPSSLSDRPRDPSRTRHSIAAPEQGAATVLPQVPVSSVVVSLGAE